MLQAISFRSGISDYYFAESFENLVKITEGMEVVIVTDKNLYSHYRERVEGYKTIVIPAGEANKSWEMTRQIIEGLIDYEVDKSHIVVGMGGGMITDITGFAAAIYMRGLSFGFIPTSLLAMVDASVGGKNGVDMGVYKNVAGSIRQPQFILFDTSFLQTLPDDEWSNGFAEIIKYACIFDKELLLELNEHDLEFYKTEKDALQRLVQKCVSYKNRTVQEDEQEHGVRKLLNFGHTIGHAIENNYGLAHGKAVAIGMIVASELSATVNDLPRAEIEFLRQILGKYRLPTTLRVDIRKVLQTMKMDKKRRADTIDFIILESLGKAMIRKTGFEEIEEVLQRILS